ncbi:MAG TPA: trifunctional transcriptional activator/DNA repair protein Ada/methylated-DNA--[protein]-cysteine S-methyltransferase [Bacteroidota bacterium]|nr:trifunctional transcriptional activator/DNA repair protein Ada/methylated-DNA--[protein]-cysteine S-methyltransferase [Bacteroidota bacterium]
MQTLPSPRTMYSALARRDSSYEGIFYAGVKTTGIFCRPTCGAKKPKPVNVEFFASPNDALFAGYRPCERCRPLQASIEPPPLVKRLRDTIEKHPTGKLTDADLRRDGIEPSTARRQFKKYYGMTFHAYHRARRMGKALREVRAGESIIGAQLNQGYESASGFWQAFRNIFGERPGKANGVGVLAARWIGTPLGAMLAVANDEGLCLLDFVDRRGLERAIGTLRNRTKSVITPGDNTHLDTITSELGEYFAGKLTRFTVPVRHGGSPFDKSVWSNLRKIPHGTTWSYAQLAVKSGNPKTFRAVAQANSRNYLAIVIPCHRVIRSDGSLSGYGGGVWRKRWLIDHEASVSRTIKSSGQDPTA